MKRRIFISILVLLLPVILFAQTRADFTQLNYNVIEYNVSVVGNVLKPGSFILPPTKRISDAIALANFVASDTLTVEVIELLANSSTRNITIKRKDRNIHVDLEKFLRYGDDDNNPFIQDGDVIIVPAIEEKVSISGSVNRGGDFELVEGDRIMDIIMLSMGFSNNAYLDSVEVVRFINHSSNTTTIFVDCDEILADPESEQNVLLQNDDRIYVRGIPNFHHKEAVTVAGEVQFPGSYAIENGVTTLYDIMVECGGPTERADLQNAYLRRRSKEDVVDTEFERLKIMLVEDMTPLEYEYFKTKSREMSGRFAADFQKLWFENDMVFNFLLKTGDYIYIPDKTVTITVSGQVRNPGLVTYVPGENYLYYIDKVGGFAWRARKGKVRVIKANTGEWLKPKETTPIEVGDMIFIPEKPDVDYWALTKDIMSIAAQIATVIIVIQNATN